MSLNLPKLKNIKNLLLPEKLEYMKARCLLSQLDRAEKGDWDNDIFNDLSEKAINTINIFNKGLEDESI